MPKSSEKTLNRLKELELNEEHVREVLRKLRIEIRVDETDSEFELIGHTGISFTGVPIDYTPENVEIAIRCFYVGLMAGRSLHLAEAQ